MKTLIWAFTFLLIAIPSWAQHHPEDHFSHLPAGGRKALHGMVLFGSGPYFLEHIPMLSPPHDFQIIALVILKDKKGMSLAQDFSHESFTLKPDKSFSLNDYVAGRLKKFHGAIYQGNFEQDGEVVKGLSDVTIEILDYKLIRQLPSQSEQAWFQLNDGKNLFESNMIRPEENAQIIRHVKTGKILWCVQGPDFFDPCPER